jgi:hypothetical protein
MLSKQSIPHSHIASVGVLAQPAERFPGSVLNNALFRFFPFLLPNIFTAFLSLTTLILVYVYLPETYKTIDVQSPPDPEAPETPVLSSTWSKRLKTFFLTSLQSLRFSGAWNLLKQKSVFYPCLAYCIVSLTSIVFDEVLVLYAMSTPDSGGLGFSHLRIGYTTSVTGFPMMVTTFILTPYLNRLYPPSSCFLYAQLLGAFFSFSAIFLPIVYHHSNGALIAVFILIATGGKCCAVVAFSSVFLLINDSVGPNERGAVNGLSVTLAGLSKAFGPMIGSILFAWSISNGLSFPLNYAFVFLLNAAIGIAGFFLPLQQDPQLNAEEHRLTSSDSSGEPTAATASGADFDHSTGLQLSQQRPLPKRFDDEEEKYEEEEAEEEGVDGELLLQGVTRSDEKKASSSENFFLRRK